MRKIVLVLVFLLIPVVAYAGYAIVSWTAPTTWSDGAPLTTITGYNVYYGNTHLGPYPNKVSVGNVTTTTINNIGNGTWYFTVTTLATNLSGSVVESAYSTEASKVIDDRVPNPPTSISVITGVGVK